MLSSAWRSMPVTQRRDVHHDWRQAEEHPCSRLDLGRRAAIEVEREEAQRQEESLGAGPQSQNAKENEDPRACACCCLSREVVDNFGRSRFHRGGIGAGGGEARLL